MFIWQVHQQWMPMVLHALLVEYYMVKPRAMCLTMQILPTKFMLDPTWAKFMFINPPEFLIQNHLTLLSSVR